MTTDEFRKQLADKHGPAVIKGLMVMDKQDAVTALFLAFAQRPELLEELKKKRLDFQ